MKFLVVAVVSFFSTSAIAQSPYLSIFVKMDSVKTEYTRYKIEMKICTPKKMTEQGDWFSHDTSAIDFSMLKAEDISCGEYFDEGMPTLISGGKEEKQYNQFQFGNQVFAWENIFVFKISNWSSRGWHPEMYIVMPMKYKSFRTSIILADIEFQSGKVIFMTDYNASYDTEKLSVDQSLGSNKGIDVKDFSLKAIL